VVEAPGDIWGASDREQRSAVVVGGMIPSARTILPQNSILNIEQMYNNERSS
jgi:hypothetical protein